MTPKHEQFRRALRKLRSALKEPNFIEVEAKDLELLLTTLVHQDAVIKELVTKHGAVAQADNVLRLPDVPGRLRVRPRRDP